MNILNAIFPGKCIICGKLFIFEKQNLFCEECLSKIKKENLIYCKSCGAKEINCQRCIKKRFYNELKIFKNTDPVLIELLYWYKIKKFKNLSHLIAEKIKEDITTFTQEKKIDLITFVPLHRKTLKERGFNHLKEILLQIFPSYMIREVVEKVRDTKLQMNLKKAERITNLDGAFRLSGSVKDKKVLIFDDIMTTGTTMLQMYGTIKKGKPEKIFGYLIGR